MSLKPFDLPENTYQALQVCRSALYADFMLACHLHEVLEFESMRRFWPNPSAQLNLKAQSRTEFIVVVQHHALFIGQESQLQESNVVYWEPVNPRMSWI
jgi:hypothetical protein